MRRTPITEPHTDHSRLSAAAPSPPREAKGEDRSHSFIEKVDELAEAVAEDTSSHERIARVAYSYWQARGGENGSAEDDWFRAEAEISGLDER